MPSLIPRLSAAERTAFIAAARSQVGRPFKHRGRTDSGVDCLGVVALALRAVGRDPEDARLYGRHPEPEAEQLRASMRLHFGEPVTDLQPGDVVLMRWYRQPNHVAVVGDYVLGGLSLIHALAQTQRVVEHRLAAPWPDRIVEAYRP